MAKKYLEQWGVIEETQYATSKFPLTAIGVANWNHNAGNIKAMAIPGSETSNTGMQVAFQRLQRIKGKTTVQAHSKKAGANYVARLDTAQDLEWVTYETKATDKWDIIIRMSKNQDLDISTGSEHLKNLAKSGTAKLYQIEEAAIKKVAAAATGTGAANAVEKLSYDRSVAKAGVIADKLDAAVDGLITKSDEFVHFTNAENVVVMIHPVLAGGFAKLEGQLYQTGTNTFPEGKGKSFRYNGIDYIVNEAFASIQGAAATEVLGALVMTKQAYMNAGASYLATDYVDTLLDEKIAGHSFGHIDSISDPARIIKFELTLAGTGTVKAKEANEA